MWKTFEKEEHANANANSWLNISSIYANNLYLSYWSIYKKTIVNVI